MYMYMDPVKNFLEVIVSSVGYDENATNIILAAGEGQKLKNLLNQGDVNLVWYNWTSYQVPSLDYFREIVRTDISNSDLDNDLLVIIRPSAANNYNNESNPGDLDNVKRNHNIPGKEYRMMLSFTKAANDTIANKFQVVENEITVLDNRVDIVEADIITIQNDITVIEGDITNLQADSTKVKTGATDSTAQYLEDKLTEGSNITITKNNVGGVESLEIASTGGGGSSDHKVIVDASDTTAGYLSSKLAQGSNVVLTVLNPGANEQVQVNVPNAAVDTKKVLVSAVDTTEDYLSAKIQAGTGISVVASGAGNEHLTITNTGGSGSSDHKVKVTTNDTTENFLSSKIVAGSNITLTVLNPGANETYEVKATNGIGGSLNYVHTQVGANTIWSINHNLNTTDVVVQTFDNDTTPNQIDYNDLEIVDANNITITFTSATAGKAVILGLGVVVADNFKVMASGVDTTPGYLTDKLAAGTGITLTPSGAGDETVTITATGGAGSGTTMEDTITQNSHGFNEGDVLKNAGTDGVYALAQANNAANAEVVGIVSEVIGINSFKLAYGGKIVNGVPAETAGEVLFLSDVTPGLLTTTKPTTIGSIDKPLCIVEKNGNEMTFFNFRGMEITSATASAFQRYRTLATISSSTTTTITCGFKPSFIKISAVLGKSSPYISNGTWDINGQDSVWADSAASSNGSGYTYFLQTGGNQWKGQITNITNTGFDIVSTHSDTDAVFALITVEPDMSVIGRQTIWKNGETTYNLATATGVQNIPHGLGYIPTYVRITGQIFAASGNGGEEIHGFSVYNGTTQNSISTYKTGNPGYTTDTNFRFGNEVTAGNYQTGVITFDATNIIINWTKDGTPTGTLNLVWEAN